MAVNEEGKFTKLDEATVKKLEEVFSLDGSVEEACFWADISRQTYYNWIKEHPEMKERFDRLRQRPFLKARQEVIAGINGNPEFALKYLERKRKKEFGTQTNIDHTTGGEPISINTIVYGGADYNTIQVPTENISTTFTQSTGQRSEEGGDNVASEVGKG